MIVKRISEYFRIAALNPKNILIVVGTQLIFGFFILPYFIKKIDPTQKLVVLDERFGYTPEKAHQYLLQIGQAGRNTYLLTLGLFDMLYPIVYSLAFSLLLSMFFQHSFSKNHYLQWFNLFPFLIAIADYFENFSIITMILQFPTQNILAAKIASAAGLVKWGGVLFNLILLFTGLFAWAMMTMVRRKRR